MGFQWLTSSRLPPVITSRDARIVEKPNTSRPDCEPKTSDTELPRRDRGGFVVSRGAVRGDSRNHREPIGPGVNGVVRNGWE